MSRRISKECTLC